MNYLIPVREVLASLGKSFHSIDARIAIWRPPSGEPQALLTGLRISPLPVGLVQVHHQHLDHLFQGGRVSNSFQIVLEALPFSEMDRITEELEHARLTAGGQQLRLPGPRRIGELRGSVGRPDSSYLHPRSPAGPCGIYCATGERAGVLENADLCREVHAKLGLVPDELIASFFERDFRAGRALDLFVYLEMPARIEQVTVVGRKLTVDLELERRLSDTKVFLIDRGEGGLESRIRRQVNVEPVNEGGAFTRWRGTVELPSAVKDVHWVRCLINHETVGTLAWGEQRLREARPLAERNPLLACLREVWDMDQEVYRYLSAPQGRAPDGEQQASAGQRPRQAGPLQSLLPKAVSRLLALCGFQAIDLEGREQIKFLGEKAVVATVDLFAYHEAANTLVFGECTINVPKREDFEKLIFATGILRDRLFTAQSPVRLVPMLFSWDESEPSGWEDTFSGISLMNAPKLRALAGLIDRGEQVRFVEYLQSMGPFPF